MVKLFTKIEDKSVLSIFIVSRLVGIHLDVLSGNLDDLPQNVSPFGVMPSVDVSRKFYNGEGTILRYLAQQNVKLGLYQGESTERYLLSEDIAVPEDGYVEGLDHITLADVKMISRLYFKKDKTDAEKEFYDRIASEKNVHAGIEMFENLDKNLFLEALEQKRSEQFELKSSWDQIAYLRVIVEQYQKDLKALESKNSKSEASDAKVLKRTIAEYERKIQYLKANPKDATKPKKQKGKKK